MGTSIPTVIEPWAGDSSVGLGPPHSLGRRGRELCSQDSSPDYRLPHAIMGLGHFASLLLLLFGDVLLFLSLVVGPLLSQTLGECVCWLLCSYVIICVAVRGSMHCLYLPHHFASEFPRKFLIVNSRNN